MFHDLVINSCNVTDGYQLFASVHAPASHCKREDKEQKSNLWCPLAKRRLCLKDCQVTPIVQFGWVWVQPDPAGSIAASPPTWRGETDFLLRFGDVRAYRQERKPKSRRGHSIKKNILPLLQNSWRMRGVGLFSFNTCQHSNKGPKLDLTPRANLQ